MKKNITEDCPEKIRNQDIPNEGPDTLVSLKTDLAKLQEFLEDCGRYEIPLSDADKKRLCKKILFPGKAGFLEHRESQGQSIRRDIERIFSLLHTSSCSPFRRAQAHRWTDSM